jgi:AraC-like DNA-binding protein
VERVASGTAIHWPDLALDLGYSDQAHFIRDFRKLIGTTPAEYARRLSSRRGPG